MVQGQILPVSGHVGVLSHEGLEQRPGSLERLASRDSPTAGGQEYAKVQVHNGQSMAGARDIGVVGRHALLEPERRA